MKVLLVSYGEAEIRDEADEGSSKEMMAEVAMCIESGSFYDKEFEVPGMAHFVEHMMFMGSKKFPEENEFSKYINVNSEFNFWFCFSIDLDWL